MEKLRIAKMGDMMRTNLWTVQDFHTMMRTDLHLSQLENPIKAIYQRLMYSPHYVIVCYVGSRKS